MGPEEPGLQYPFDVDGVAQKRGCDGPSRVGGVSGVRLALGVSYRGNAYHGWQSQPDGCTVQDVLERALSQFADVPVTTLCAGRTDTGVHGLNQVVHLDAPVAREPFSWVRGTNRYLPPDVAVQWCQPVAADFHARNSATGRHYAYILLESPVRPAIEAGAVGWTFRPLDGEAMRAAADHLLGEHGGWEVSLRQAVQPLHRGSQPRAADRRPQ